MTVVLCFIYVFDPWKQATEAITIHRVSNPFRSLRSPLASCWCPAGGAAGMVSRITGSVGKGLAAITMDKEFQQKRREEMNRAPKDFGESLAKGGKGLLKVTT